MGVTYYANTPGVKNYDTNFCGADLLGYVHWYANLTTIPHPTEAAPRIPYEATQEEAVHAAEAIARMPDAKYAEIANHYNYLFVGGMAELKEIVAEWINWLSQSGGYHC